MRIRPGVIEFYVDINFAIRTVNWPLELDHWVTDFYVMANFAIGPIDWQLDFPAPFAGALDSTSPATTSPPSGWPACHF